MPDTIFLNESSHTFHGKIRQIYLRLSLSPLILSPGCLCLCASRIIRFPRHTVFVSFLLKIYLLRAVTFTVFVSFLLSVYRLRAVTFMGECREFDSSFCLGYIYAHITHTGHYLHHHFHSKSFPSSSFRSTFAFAYSLVRQQQQEHGNQPQLGHSPSERASLKPLRTRNCDCLTSLP